MLLFGFLGYLTESSKPDHHRRDIIQLESLVTDIIRNWRTAIKQDITLN